jgi:site-specific recombinase XerD
LSDCEARHLKPESFRKYIRFGKELAARFGNQGVDTLSVEDVAEYRESWKLSPMTARRKIEWLRSFFRFCVDRGYCEKNPAMSLKHPRAEHRPTLPAPDDDFDKLIAACETFPNKKAKAFLLTLRYSGLRIQDCVLLKRESLRDGKIFLRTVKTGVQVWVPIPYFVSSELSKIESGDCFFYSRTRSVRCAIGIWQRTIERVGKRAGVKFHAHQLRDSFATSLLLKGVPLETVAVLLGNSVKICGRHYSAWIQARQEHLEEAVRRTFLT